jgi:hypothetical protein
MTEAETMVAAALSATIGFDSIPHLKLRQATYSTTNPMYVHEPASKPRIRNGKEHDLSLVR